MIPNFHFNQSFLGSIPYSSPCKKYAGQFCCYSSQLQKVFLRVHNFSDLSTKTNIISIVLIWLILILLNDWENNRSNYYYYKKFITVIIIIFLNYYLTSPLLVSQFNSGLQISKVIISINTVVLQYICMINRVETCLLLLANDKVIAWVDFDGQGKPEGPEITLWIWLQSTQSTHNCTGERHKHHPDSSRHTAWGNLKWSPNQLSNVQ